MNHPENITFILVVYYFAKKKVRKTKRNRDFSFIFADLYAILAHLYAILDLYVRFYFRRQKQAPCKNKYEF